MAGEIFNRRKFSPKKQHHMQLFDKADYLWDNAFINNSDITSSFKTTDNWEDIV